MQTFRVEKDILGEVQIPAKAYYGIASSRARGNFYFSGETMKPSYIKALAIVKKAAANANFLTEIISEKKYTVINHACDEIIAGKFLDAFITETLQGGAGTSFNMNMNEVIANRANELLGFPLGSYAIVKVNDDVNASQSTNDVIPTAAKLALLWDIQILEEELVKLEQELHRQAGNFSEILKMGRTHLQDAVPMTLGQQFSAFQSSTTRSRIRLEQAKAELLTINMGATAIGTGINATRNYAEKVTKELISITGFDFILAEDLVDATRNADCYLQLSSTLKMIATNLSKIATDLRLLASGPQAGFGEISLPKRQAGSSIMPSKVNPVIPEVMNQIAFTVIGNDLTVTLATEAGELELNVFEPAIISALFDSLKLLTSGVHAFRTKAIIGIIPNKEYLASLTLKSDGLATILVPYIGYEQATTIVSEAKSTGKTVSEILLKKRIFNKKELKEIFDVAEMTIQK